MSELPKSLTKPTAEQRQQQKVTKAALDSLPLVPPDLLTYLDELYPSDVNLWDLRDIDRFGVSNVNEAIHFMRGTLRVVEHLRALHQKRLSLTRREFT